jgi:hypothetical protein
MKHIYFAFVLPLLFTACASILQAITAHTTMVTAAQAEASDPCP